MTDHGGHRDRLRERFREEGLEHFHDVNVLELLLFYAMPRRDTNPVAHALIDRFGSLAGVLNASEEDLLQVEDVGPGVVTFLHLLPQVMRRYLIQSGEMGEILPTTESCGKYLVPYFIGAREEQVYLLCLDAKCKVLACRLLQRGSVNTAGVSVRRVVETAIATNATSVVLAHNHTSGIALPSDADKLTTRKIREALDAVGILLADHIVVAGEDFVSMADDGFFEELQPLT